MISPFLSPVEAGGHNHQSSIRVSCAFEQGNSQPIDYRCCIIFDETLDSSSTRLEGLENLASMGVRDKHLHLTNI